MRGPLVLAGLLSLALAAAALPVRAADPAADEPNDSPAAATFAGKVGFSLTDRSLPAGDTDWYRFEVPSSGTTITIELALDAGIYDTGVALEIRSADGVTLLASGVPGEMNGVQTAIAGPLDAGVYLVSVAHASGMDLDAYSLRSTRDNDAAEGNDTSGDATDAGSLGFVRTGHVLPAADADWYRFEVAESGARISAEVTFDADAYDTTPILEIRSGSGGAILATGVAAGPGRWVAQTAPLAAGTCFIRVAHGSGADLLEYALRTWRDDGADEPNDDSAAATNAGSVGFARTGRVLNFADVDWYRFDVPAAAGPVTVDLSYDMAAHDTDMTVELRTAGDALIAAATPLTNAGPFRASVGVLTEGTYFLRIAHDGGDAVPSYTVQAYTPLTLAAMPQVETSVGAQLDVPFDIRGGIRPYTLAVDPRFPVPPGLVFDGETARMTGSVATSGRTTFLVACRDAGSPANTANVLMTLVVNPRLDVRVGEFTAFAAGKPAIRTIPSTGGTAPFVVTTTSGALPDGISLTTGTLGFVGAAGAAMPGALPARVQFDVTDAAGLTDSVDTTCVLCTPFGAHTLADGSTATGVTFDAVKGSTVSVKVVTAKRAAKRALRAVLLGSDGTTEVAADIRTGNGTASIPRFVAPTTGRYYLVLASETGAATELVVTGRIVPPARGSGRVAFTGGAEPLAIEIGALEGAVLTFSARPDRKGPTLSIVGLLDPSGTPVAVDPARVRTKAGAVSFSAPLGSDGTWTVLVNAALGTQTDVLSTWTVKQPKKAVYSAD